MIIEKQIISDNLFDYFIFHLITMMLLLLCTFIFASSIETQSNSFTMPFHIDNEKSYVELNVSGTIFTLQLCTDTSVLLLSGNIQWEKYHTTHQLNTAQNRSKLWLFGACHLR